MSQNDLLTLFKKRFISRADVMAIQTPSGDYRPYKRNDEYVPWSNERLAEHLSGEFTYGHYMVAGDQCKLFVFDIDLKESGPLPTLPHPATVDPSFGPDDVLKWENSFRERNPREAWRYRAHVSRPYIKTQLHIAAHKIARVIHEDLELETAVAYSGHKGVHVYGFTGKKTAFEIREAGDIVMGLLGGFHKSEKFPMLLDWDEFPIFSVELYPKQDSVGEGFGNLVRLPLGRNLKAPKDPTFFVDMTSPLNELTPIDPVWALTGGAVNPWKKPEEA